MRAPKILRPRGRWGGQRALALYLCASLGVAMIVVVTPAGARGVVIPSRASAQPSASAPPSAARPQASAAKRVKKPPPKKQETAAKPAETVDPSTLAVRRARELADARRYVDALAVIAPALENDPGHKELLYLQAGVTAWADRNREAVVLYEALVARFPELARETRRDLAAQRLWSGDPAGAIRDLDQRLEEEPADREARRLRAIALSHADRLAEALVAYDALRDEDPRDREIALDRARILGWMGRHRQASSAYREILREHPEEVRAQLGLAQNENWRGEHRRAARLFEDLIRGEGADPEAHKGLAFARYWTGQRESARDALDAYLARRPGDPEGLALSALIAREESPSLTTGFARSDDSDALRIRSTTMEYRYPLAHLSTVWLGWRRDNVKDPGGNRDPLQVGAGVEKTWSERWSGRAMVSYFAPEKDENGRGVGEAAVAWRPNDRVHLEAGYAQQPVLSRVALSRGVLIRTLDLGMNWVVRDRAAVQLEQRFHGYTHDNRARRSAVAARAMVISEPRSRLALTFGVEQLATDEDRDDGYYDPESYYEFGPGVDWEWEPQPRWRFGFVGRFGAQKEKGSDQETLHNFTATAEFPLGSPLALTIEGSQSNSNLSSATGFSQKRWAAYLTTGF